MSSKAREILKENIQRYGTISEYEVKERQEKIVDVIQTLIGHHVFTVSHSGEDEVKNFMPPW
jgi:flagellar motor switch protein FliG